jgi:hypothetical protein
MNKYFGKYKGRVSSNTDELGRGRIKVTVDEILETPTWAEPCVPYAAPGKGLLMVPPENGDVWVEFKEGDLQFPIWTGCFWSQPLSAPLTPIDPPATTKILALDGLTVKVNESAAGATVEITVGTSAVSVEVSPSGVTIDAQGSVSISGIPVTANGLEIK